MPRLTTRLPKIRNHKGYAVVALGGEKIHLGKYGSKIARAEYDRVVGEWMTAGRPSMVATHDLTVGDVMLQYLRWAKQYHGANTDQVNSAKATCNILKRRYEHTPVEQFGPKSLKALQQQMIDDGGARTYVNEICKRIRHIFRWAASEELIPGAIVENLKQVAGLKKGKTSARETVPVGPVSDEVIAATLVHLRKPVGDMVKLHRLLGCRPTELCEMKTKYIHDREAEVWVYTPGHHKTEDRGKVRNIPIGPRSQLILAPFLLRGHDDWCFESKRHRCYSEDSYRNAIKRAAEIAFPIPEQWSRKESESAKAWKERLASKGERTPMEEWRATHHWSPNRLRHSRGTEIRKQYGLEPAAAVLGHSELATTQVYAERDMQVAIDVARKTG